MNLQAASPHVLRFRSAQIGEERVGMKCVARGSAPDKKQRLELP